MVESKMRTTDVDKIISTLQENLMISEVDITDMKELYEMEYGKHFKLAPQDDVRVPPDSNDITADDVYIFMGIDGMYSKCVGSNGVMHHFAAWTKVVPWVK
jgi:hypothetical protein